MKIVDTVVLVASNDLQHKLYKKAKKYLLALRESYEVYIPSTTLLEYDIHS